MHDTGLYSPGFVPGTYFVSTWLLPGLHLVCNGQVNVSTVVCTWYFLGMYLLVNTGHTPQIFDHLPW